MAELFKKVDDLISTKSEEIIIQNIKNLLDIDSTPDNLREIQKLSIYLFKDFTTDECQLISNLLKVRTIKELANVPYKQLLSNVSLFREAGIPQKKIELMLTAAKYIVNVATYKPLEGQKVVVAGLDNAGKSALLKVIKKEAGDISNLKPTQGMNRESISLKDYGLDLYIYELGGQERYRKMYIDHPEKYILGVDIMVFLVDMQDPDRFQDALNYLQKLMDTIKLLNENPLFILLLHKSDPDLFRKDPLFQEKLDYVTDLLHELFQSYVFEYEIQISSIYSKFTPSFQVMLKTLVTGDVQKEQERATIGEIITQVTELILALDKKLDSELESIKYNVNTIQNELNYLRQTQKTGATITPQLETSEKESKPPKEAPASPSVVSKPTASPRDAIMSELRALFSKRHAPRK
ncbi:MAG TPA: ADP-ribosylation factor-like protein [Candidatus Deferrimicrobium sp.]|nr:ADP-ribosylation factor-like protein [Candidatus Deferrimicrobium sp.]